MTTRRTAGTNSNDEGRMNDLQSIQSRIICLVNLSFKKSMGGGETVPDNQNNLQQIDYEVCKRHSLEIWKIIQKESLRHKKKWWGKKLANMGKSKHS